MQLFPLEFEILSGLVASSAAPAAVQPMDVPGLVITVLPTGLEKLAVSSNGEVAIKHGHGFHFADRQHDWAMRDGKFFYFSHDLAPSGRGPAGQDQKADVMLVYKWMEVGMDASGDPEGRSTLKAVRHGFPMTVEIQKGKGRRGEWEAAFSQPSLGRIPLDQLDEISRAQLALGELARKELSRRWLLHINGQPTAPKDEATLAEAPAPG